MNKKTKIIVLLSTTVISILGILAAIFCAKIDLTTNNMMNRGPINDVTLTLPYIFVIAFFASILSIIIIYMIMSRKNKKFYKNKDKIIIYILSNIILISLITVSTTVITNNYILNSKEETAETEKEEVKLDKSNVVEPGNVNLSKQTTDVTITESGTYTLTGEFENSVIIDAEDEDITLVLNNVTIEAQNTASIIGLNAKSITIELKEDTENTLSDGGNSEYDGCIFSNAELIFTGTGKLVVNGNQNEGEGIATEAQNITINSGTYVITSNDDGINAGGDGATITINGGVFYINASGDGIDSNKDAVINGGTIFVIGSDTGGDSGIDTDAGYTINAGTVVALGTDMIETPNDNSAQNTIAFTLNDKITKDTLVTLMKEDETIISFIAPKSFKTIIISSEKLSHGTYSLYTDGMNSGTKEYGIYKDGSYTKGDILSVNNQTTFEITKTINLFGNK